MRDIDQAQQLGIDTSDMVVVTHPDKRGRFGGDAEFTMTRLAFVKRGMEDRGYVIVGEAGHATKPTGREQSLMAEVEALRNQLAAKNSSNQSRGAIDDTTRDDLRAKLDALGVKYHHKSGVAKLQEQYDEAIAAINADDFGDEDDDPT